VLNVVRDSSKPVGSFSTNVYVASPPICWSVIDVSFAVP
jgi:hypothetical protein